MISLTDGANYIYQEVIDVLFVAAISLANFFNLQAVIEGQK